MWGYIHHLQWRKHKQLCMECEHKMEGEITVLRPDVLPFLRYLFGWCISRLLKTDPPIIALGVFCSDECSERYMERRGGALTIVEDA